MERQGHWKADVSAIIVNHNTRDLLFSCVQMTTRLAASGVSEIIVVDNASSDGSVEILKESFPDVKIIASEQNLGYGRACNLGMEQAADSDFFLLLNTDVELGEEALGRLISAVVDDHTIGIASCQLTRTNGRLQDAHFHEFPFDKKQIDGNCGSGAESCAWIAGALMLVRRECWLKTGGFDPAIFLYAEELEWCYRAIKLGWKVAFVPGVRAIHHCGQTASSYPTHKIDLHLYLGQLTFFSKHYPKEWVRRYKRKRFAREVRGVFIHRLLSNVPGGTGVKNRRKYLAYASRLMYWLAVNHIERRTIARLVDAEARQSAMEVFGHWRGNKLLFPNEVDTRM